MSWTDERVELLKKMWAEGQSASQIAKELGGVTRNAVIGKVHRLGLSNRTGPGGAPGPVPAQAPAAPPAAPAAPPAKEAKIIKETKGRPAPQPEAELEDDAPAKRAPVDIDMDEDMDEAETRPVPSPARKAIVPAGQPLPPQPSAKVSEIEKKAKRLTLMELTERTCKWPVGDPATPDFWFCGLPVQQGKPYCEAHVGVAFQPMSSRRDRRR